MSYCLPEKRVGVKVTNKPLMLVDLTIQGQSYNVLLAFNLDSKYVLHCLYLPACVLQMQASGVL